MVIGRNAYPLVLEAARQRNITIAAVLRHLGLSRPADRPTDADLINRRLRQWGEPAPARAYFLYALLRDNGSLSLLLRPRQLKRRTLGQNVVLGHHWEHERMRWLARLAAIWDRMTYDEFLDLARATERVIARVYGRLAVGEELSDESEDDADGGTL